MIRFYMLEITFDIAGQLLPDIKTMVIQLIAIGVLFYFAKRWLWGPARDYMKKRADYAQDQITQAESMRLEAEELHGNANRTMKDAGLQARELVDKAKQDSLLLKDSILKDARQEAEQKMEAARRQIDFEKNAMREDVAKEIVEVAMTAVEKLLEEKAVNTDDRKAIERFVKEVNAQ